MCGGTQLTRGKLGFYATDAVETKQSYLWRLEKCGVRIKAWEARVIQLEALGAVRECRPKLVARLKQARIVDDAEDECDGEIVSLGASRSGRQTERVVREASCDKRSTVVKEGDTISVLCDTVSFKTVRLRVVRAGLRVVCDSCERSVSAAQGLLISDFDHLRVIQDESKCAGCLMTAGTGVWESHECDKTGQLRKDCSV